MTSSVIGCKRVHSIIVEQLEDLDQVEHSLLLIKGRLQPKCTNARQLKATLDWPARDKSEEQLTQLSTTGEFKLLYDLDSEKKSSQIREVEQLHLHLRCCSGSRLINFTYRPRRSHYRVQPLYLVCKDENEFGELATARCSLIDLNLRLVQCIYAHKLNAAGFPNRFFTLNDACKIFQSSLTQSEVLERSEDELWQHFASEILASSEWGQQVNLKFCAFVGCTRYNGAAVTASGDFTYENIRRHLHGHAALGGGGLALFGSGHFYAWPQSFTAIGDCIRSKERVDIGRLPDESNYRRTYGGVYASTLGAVCHELGHCFDLGHTRDGVMGQGFDYLNRVLTVDQLTEHLPQRIVAVKSNNQAPIPSPSAAAPSTSATRLRLTQLKKPINQHLDNYHTQRLTDSFYFTRNCAVILAQHRWLRDSNSEEEKQKQDPSGVNISLDLVAEAIISTIPLRLIELRCNLDSLVAHYEEFAEDKLSAPVYQFPLPGALWHLLAKQRTHYVFVLTRSGDTKRLACD
ncbi:uncharacterized protein [Drosophila tropicalis]|uniref:uncharacterized protein n=1 Tax=Drosophila tropicalis TaxID=46794 RepID=UPI0035ABBBC2